MVLHTEIIIYIEYIIRKIKLTQLPLMICFPPGLVENTVLSSFSSSLKQALRNAILCLEFLVIIFKETRIQI